ncbi:MAG: serine/threonine protein kinase, partial [Acidobacteriota bacterium]
MTTGPAAARYAPGAELDGFTLGERIHSGAMGHIYQVTRASSPFPLIMKVPRVGPGETGEGIINFETEAMLLPALAGSHVPRFVARGNLSRTPYLVTEWIEGESLDRRLA